MGVRIKTEFYFAIPKLLLSISHNSIPDSVFSQGKLMLIFKRKIKYHILRIYLPSILLVFVSSLSMALPLSQVPGKTNTIHGPHISKVKINPIRKCAQKLPNYVNFLRGHTLWCQIVYMGGIKTSWVFFVKPQHE